MNVGTMGTGGARGIIGLLFVAATLLMARPAEAQRYDPHFPVCLQKWEWGGSNTINCSYTSWEACKASAAGLSAMCLANPYWPQPSAPGPGSVRSPSRRMW